MSAIPSNQCLYEVLPTENRPGPLRKSVPWSHGGMEPTKKQTIQCVNPEKAFEVNVVQWGVQQIYVNSGRKQFLLNKF